MNGNLQQQHILTQTLSPTDASMSFSNNFDSLLMNSDCFLKLHNIFCLFFFFLVNVPMSRRHKNDYSPDVGKRQRIDSIPEPRRGSPYVRTPHLRPCHDEEEAGFLRFSNGFDHNCHSQSSEELPEVLIVPHIPDSLDSYARDKVLLDFSFVQFYIRPLTATYFLKTNCFIWSLSNTVLEVRDGSLEILFICMSSCSSAGFSNGGAV